MWLILPSDGPEGGASEKARGAPSDTKMLLMQSRHPEVDISYWATNQDPES